MNDSQDMQAADKLFKQQFNQLHMPTARYVAYGILFMFVLFAAWDLEALGLDHPELNVILCIRFSFTLPVILYVVFYSFQTDKKHQDILTTAMCLIAFVTVVVLHWKFYTIGQHLKLNSIMLIMIAIYFLPNILFAQKLFLGVSLIFSYFIYLYVTQQDYNAYINSGMYLLCINVAGLIHSIHFDKQRRVIFYKTEFLKKLALTDQLTGADNRHKFDEHFVELLEQGKEEQKGIAIAIADIDFFKQFNDTYGHFAGDECLIKVAQTFLEMKQHPLDRCIRFGGEEFILIKYDVNLNESVEWGQSIIDTIYQLNIPHSSSTAESKVTISAGVIHWSPSSSLTRTELMKQADEALYQAKNNGRNQVHFSNLS